MIAGVIPLWLGVVILCVYGVVLVWLLIEWVLYRAVMYEWRQLHGIRTGKDAERVQARHDYDEACRLKGIKEGTWQ